MVFICVEYFVFEKGMYVLVILIDLINYVEVFCEVLVVRKEVLGRRGYLGYLYIDFL